jgi:hypothetical protein
MVYFILEDPFLFKPFLQVFYDLDWFGDPNDRRSIIGFGVFIGPCLVSWCVMSAKYGVFGPLDLH